MVVIYIKLLNATNFYDEKLGFTLQTGGQFKIQLDFSNLNENIVNGLNNDDITQISESEYYGEDPNPPTTSGCCCGATTWWTTNPVPDTAIFTFKYLNVCYRVPYSLMKSSGPDKYHRVFRVGDGGELADQETVFQDDALKGIAANRINVKVTGISIYQYADDPVNVDYYTFNTVAGTITRPAKFKEEEVIEITQV